MVLSRVIFNISMWQSIPPALMRDTVAVNGIVVARPLMIRVVLSPNQILPGSCCWAFPSRAPVGVCAHFQAETDVWSPPFFNNSPSHSRGTEAASDGFLPCNLQIFGHVIA